MIRPLKMSTRPYATEPLESRRLLAISVAGTAAADVIRVAADGAQVLVVVNGVENRFNLDPEGIIINAGDGNDTLRLDDASNLPVTLNGDGANDQFIIGNGDVRAARFFSVDVVGGAGSDSLTIDDSLAEAGNTAVAIDNPIDTFVSVVAAPGSIIRSDASSTANAVEAITFNASAQDDNVYVHGTSALATLTINGANGNDTMTVGNDLDSFLKGPVTLDGSLGADVLTIDDSADSFVDTYFLGGTASTGTVRKNSGGSTATFTGFGNVSLLAGLGGAVKNNQFFRVTSLPDAINTTIFAGSGDDTLYLGDGVVNLDNFKSNLVFDGEGDIDSIVYTDTVGTDASSYGINPSTITNAGTATLNFVRTEAISLLANPIGNDIRVNQTASDLSVTVNGGGGNDIIHVGNGDFDATILNGVSVIGGAGTDTLVIEDQNDDPGNDSYTFNSGTMTKGDFVALWSTGSSDRVENVSLLASENNDTIRVNSATPAIRMTLDGGAGDDSFFIASTTEGASTATTVTVVGGSGNDSIDVNSDNAGSDALVAFTSPVEEFGSFRIRAGGRATIASGRQGVLAVRGLLTVAGKLDVADATMIVSAGDFATIDALAVAGYSDNTWTGGAATAAIVSNAAAASVTLDAVAVVKADDLSLPVYSGVATASGDVVVRYTLAGDANLDRVVDFNDLTVLAQHYNQLAMSWVSGEFTFDVDHAVRFEDLVSLAKNYLASVL